MFSTKEQEHFSKEVIILLFHSETQLTYIYIVIYLKF
jgi:hypothetical protein